MTDPYYYVPKVAVKYAITLDTKEAPPAALPADKRCDWLVEAMARACHNREGYAVKTSAEVNAEWTRMGSDTKG